MQKLQNDTGLFNLILLGIANTVWLVGVISVISYIYACKIICCNDVIMMFHTRYLAFDRVTLIDLDFTFISAFIQNICSTV